MASASYYWDTEDEDNDNRWEGTIPKVRDLKEGWRKEWEVFLFILRSSSSRRVTIIIILSNIFALGIWILFPWGATASIAIPGVKLLPSILSFHPFLSSFNVILSNSSSFKDPTCPFGFTEGTRREDEEDDNNQSKLKDGNLADLPFYTDPGLFTFARIEGKRSWSSFFFFYFHLWRQLSHVVLLLWQRESLQSHLFRLH